MKVIKNLVVNVLISAILLYVLSYYQIGIIIEFVNTGSLLDFLGVILIIGLIFWIFNSPIKWILKTLSCPVNFLTLGLFSLVINVIVFYMFQYAVNFFFEGELVVHLGNVVQTLILSFIMAVGSSIGAAILKVIL